MTLIRQKDIVIKFIKFVYLNILLFFAHRESTEGLWGKLHIARQGCVQLALDVMCFGSIAAWIEWTVTNSLFSQLSLCECQLSTEPSYCQLLKVKSGECLRL